MHLQTMICCLLMVKIIVGYERLLVNNCEITVIYRSIHLFILTILLIILSDRITFQKILFD